MRYFARLLSELQEIARGTRPGQRLRPPPLLDSVVIQGKRVCFAQMGLSQKHGPAIVLLHGFGGFFMDWPRVMAPLAGHYHVFVPDLPGWGFSEPRNSPTEIEGDVEMLRLFLESQCIQKVVLVGLSYGGGVTWAAAAQRLPQIQKIVLLNPMPPFPMRYLKSPLYRGIMWVNSRLWRARLSHKFVTKFQYKTICKENLFNPRLLDTFYLDLGYLVLKQPHVADTLHQHSVGARMIDWQKWEDRLRDVNVPTLILQGKQDKLFSPESARYLASLIPNARLHEIDRCGHAMIFDHHREVIRQVSHWIEGSDA